MGREGQTFLSCRLDHSSCHEGWGIAFRLVFSYGSFFIEISGCSRGTMLVIKQIESNFRQPILV